MIKKIISRLEPFDDWVNNTSEEENLAARDALKEFLWQIKDLKPSSEYAKSSITQLHTSYILHLIAIKKLLFRRNIHVSAMRLSLYLTKSHLCSQGF